MARLIDADVAIERAKESDKIVGSSIWETGEVVEFLEDCPIVDAVEVIRCKNCQSHEPCEVRNRVWCRQMGRYMKEDGFCSEGKSAEVGNG